MLVAMRHQGVGDEVGERRFTCGRWSTSEDIAYGIGGQILVIGDSTQFAIPKGLGRVFRAKVGRTLARKRLLAGRR